jgi:rubrerythrin
MSQLSEKELACINDSLAEEELLVKKYQMLAQHSSDNEVSAKMEEISQRHQKHFNEIYSLLG